jgi:hypothetical protein
LHLRAPPATTTGGGAVRLAPPYALRVRGARVLSGRQAYALAVAGPRVTLAATGICGGDPFAPPAAPPAADAARLSAFTAATAALASTLILLLAGAAAWQLRAAAPPFACACWPAKGATTPTRMGVFRVKAVDQETAAPTDVSRSPLLLSPAR